MFHRVIQGDCRKWLPKLPAVDAVIVDPPYGQTSLEWDRPVRGWLGLVNLKPSGSVWVFGSLRSLLANAAEFDGWKLAQDIIWQKHNGSNFHNDRFRRIHEQAAQYYRGKWRDIYHEPVYTLDVAKKQMRRKRRPPHMGNIDAGHYTSEDGGPRLQRSVIAVRSEHGRAVHPTQKPVGILRPLIEYSCPPGGIVLDPFCGSGSTLVAAKECGRSAIGIEIDPHYAAIARERLS